MIVRENSERQIQKIEQQACGQVIESATICEKYFHACDNSEMLKKNKMVLVKASMHVNESNYSLKSSRHHSHKAKHKKRQKRSVSHEQWTYPKKAELDVQTTPRCIMGCQSYNVNVRNELCNVRLMSFDKIEDVMHIPQI